MPEQFIDNVLATPQAVLYSENFERFEAVFAGAGDTLSAALSALLANGHDLQAATAEALTFPGSQPGRRFPPRHGQYRAGPDVLGAGRHRPRRRGVRGRSGRCQ
jgi:hydroxymethylpyrimidine/phosphomethylpyrimidine kinase